MNPNARAHELIGVSESLIHVMTQEIELLKAGKVSEIEPLQEQKQSLAGLYETHLRSVAAEPGAFADIEPAIRDDLEQAAVRFQTTAAENANAVRAAMDVNAQLVKVIADSVIRSAPSASGYTKTGAIPTGPARNAPPPRPATLNRSL
jgi:flagellar biosynthesis/type III secretory pathway chaperone